MASGAASAAPASPLALVLSDEPRLLPASELHDRLALMEAAAKAYRAELQRRPEHCRSPEQAVSGAEAAAAPAFLQTHLSDDEIEVVFGAVVDSLAPHVAVALASTCHGLRVPTVVALAELRRRHEAAKALMRKERNGKSCAAVGEARQLNWDQKGLTVADCTALGDVVATHGLPRLVTLNLSINYFGAEGMQALAEGLGSGALPSLTRLILTSNDIGESGASALGAALGRGALPRLQELLLGANSLGSAGLIELAPGLRARPQLEKLWLNNNGNRRRRRGRPRGAGRGRAAVARGAAPIRQPGKRRGLRGARRRAVERLLAVAHVWRRARQH